MFAAEGSASYCASRLISQHTCPANRLAELKGMRTSPLPLQDAAIAKRSAVRNFLMHGFHLLVMMVVGHQIRDTQCGFKVWAVTR